MTTVVGHTYYKCYIIFVIFWCFYLFSETRDGACQKASQARTTTADLQAVFRYDMALLIMIINSHINI